MRAQLMFAGLLLTFSACAVPAEPVVTQANMAVSPDNPACRDYTMQVLIDGSPQTVTGHACEQPDKSWRVTESVAGQPQVVVIYPAPYPAYVYDPWLWGPPIGFSIGAFAFVPHGHGHHFFAFHHHEGFMSHGFHHHGFHHGGFAHSGGFHHGT